MEASQLRYPVLGIGPDWGAYAGTEALWAFHSISDLTDIGSGALNGGAVIGTLLVDARGQGFKITEARRLGRAGNPLLHFLGIHRRYAIHLTLVDVGPVPLDEVKAHILKSIDDHADSWRNDELIVGEGGQVPVDEETQLEEHKSRVRVTENIPELIQSIDVECWIV